MPTIRHSKMKLSPQRLAALRAKAHRIDADEAEEIKARGRGVFAAHEYALEVVAALKAARRAKKLSLSDVAARANIAKPNLSRLENNPVATPSLDTISRYAGAIGYTVKLNLVPQKQDKNQPA